MKWEVWCFDDNGKMIGQSRLTSDTEISQLVVQEPYRRQGIAEKMVAALELIAKESGYGRVFATTEVDNEPSKSLWVKRGYKKYDKYEKKIVQS